MTFSRFSACWAGLVVVMPGLGLSACGDDGGKAATNDGCESGNCAGASGNTGGSQGAGASTSGGEKMNGSAGSSSQTGGEESNAGSPNVGAPTMLGDAGGPSSTGDGGAGGAPTVELSALGEGCDQDQNCQSGACVDGVCCESSCEGLCFSCNGQDTGGDDGNCLPVSDGDDPDDDCADNPLACSPGLCNGSGACQKAADGSVCREKAGDCDVAELCSEGACAADALLPAETVCRESAGDCDVAELCSGGSPACPAEAYLAAESVCRPSTGPCDIADLCSGSGPTCGNEFSYEAVQECGSYKCSGQVATCTTMCNSNANCGTGTFCHQQQCLKGKRMFVTSTTYSALIDAVTDADDRCQARATAAGLTGTFKAWLSKTTNAIATRSTHSSEPYYRMDGTVPRVIANDWDDLVDGVLVAVATDEYGEVRGYVPAFTGTEYNGTALANNCQNWNSVSAQVTFAAGNSSAGGGQSVGQTWSSYWSYGCDTAAHYFCIEQ